jgi:hypothetical protein
MFTVEQVFNINVNIIVLAYVRSWAVRHHTRQLSYNHKSTLTIVLTLWLPRITIADDETPTNTGICAEHQVATAESLTRENVRAR